LNLNAGCFVLFCFVFLLSLFRSENRVSLSCGVQVAGAAWRAATRTVVGVGDLMQRTGNGRTGRAGTRWPDGREVGWRRVRSTPSTWRLEARVSWLSLKTKVDGLCVVWPQNHSDGFRWFGLKTSGDGFHRFGLKTGGDGFSRFGLKTGGGFLG
jgi:hypothetical protein